MTVGFVRATKAYLLPTVLGDVFRFRKAFLTADGVLSALFSAISAANGTTTAISTLRTSYLDTPVSCQGFQPSGYSNLCPWGLLSFVENAATSLGVMGSISEAEVRSIVPWSWKEIYAVAMETGVITVVGTRHALNVSPSFIVLPFESLVVLATTHSNGLVQSVYKHTYTLCFLMDVLRSFLVTALHRACHVLM